MSGADLTEYRAMLGRRPTRGARIGVVVSVALAEMQCTVLLGGGEVAADLTDQVIDLVSVGAVVTVLPVGDTYEVISTRSGTGGGGGLTLGPELLPNPSFEYGVDMPTGWGAWPWVTGDWSAGRDTTPGEAVSGDAHFRATLTGGADDPAVRLWNSDAVMIDEATNYQLSAWVKAPAGDASLVVDLILITAPLAPDASPFGTGSTPATAATVAAPGGAYQLLTGSVTVPAGHAYGRAYLSAYADASIAAPVVVAWDLASLRQRITD